MFNWENIWNMSKPFLRMVLIILIGHFIIVYLVKMLRKMLEKSKTDVSLAGFLVKAVNITLHILVVLTALNAIGVSTTGILAALSAAVVAVAVALKDSLGNVAGGILLLISPSFSSGDYIAVGGDEGTVLRVDLLHTTLRTVDNKIVSIPNGVLINSHITNYTRESERRVDITFSVSYETDAEKAKELIRDTILKHPLVLSEPDAPMVRVMKYSESSVDIVTRSWCNTSDYWTVYFDLMESVRDVLEQNGIGIPYNQLDVHIIDNETK
ncbi:MAG: mechanosensitive ion channel family protein [Clostridiales bacterium]|nr:mechanosensitive ion channel family protein [Clostridiales bacterium]